MRVGQAPAPRLVSGPGRVATPLPALPPIAALPPMLGAQPVPIPRAQTPESHFAGGPTHPMSVDFGASYPSLSVERRAQQKGRRLAVVLTLVGLLGVGFFWGRWFIAEQQRKSRPLPPASAEEEGAAGAITTPGGTASGASTDDAQEALAKLEAQLLRMMGSRHLTVSDLMRSKDSSSLAAEWQEHRRRPATGVAHSAISQLIELMRNEFVVARILQDKLAHVVRAIDDAKLAPKEKKALLQQHAQIQNGLENTADQGRTRRLGSSIAELEERLLRGGQADSPAGR